jgi:hypothetical protein
MVICAMLGAQTRHLSANLVVPTIGHLKLNNLIPAHVRGHYRDESQEELSDDEIETLDEALF